MHSYFSWVSFYRICTGFLVFFLCLGSVYADSYLKQDIESKLEKACQAFVANIVSARVEPGGFEDHNYSYEAKVIESWQVDWDFVEFSLTRDIGIGGKVFVVVGVCSETSDFGDLSIGLGQEVYAINRMIDLYDNEWWLEISVGTHVIPESWQTYEVRTRYSGKYSNRFLRTNILVSFEKIREILSSE